MAALDMFPARARLATAALGLALATAAVAQTATDAQEAPNSVSSLKLPSNPHLFGQGMPSVIKATAIVNGQVITQSDVDHRLALLAISNGGSLPADQMDQLRQQVLRNLIDESLQIEAAKAADITVTDKDIDKMVNRVASNVHQTPDQLADYLRENGSSINSIRRQVEAEISWTRLLRAKVENTISVGDDEVKAVLDKMNASKGTEEFHVGEIYLADGASADQAMATANKILTALRGGASFVGYARQFSQASTAAVGGDLGWVRPEQLPDPIAAVVRTMAPNTVSNPIPVAGGVSIIAVQDRRKILTADPRNAVLSLKQVSISFPKGTTAQQAEPVVAKFAEAARNIGGCGGADKLSTEFHGELVQSDGVKMKELPGALQEIMLPMQVGQATRPFGSVEEGVRVLVICGRDEVDAAAPSFDSVYSQINEERINLRAQRYLRDLRRDAVIEFR